jgi:protoheme ferro-lyase
MPIGVIPTTYGEPPRNSFAEQWMYSYRILLGLTRRIAPIPRLLLPIIATSRARGRVKLWGENGFSSPLEPLHERTVEALDGELRRRGADDLIVVPAYEFRKPGIGEALRQVKRLGCDRAVVLPMYVADGDFTHGITRLKVGDALAAGKIARDVPSEVSLCMLADDEATTDRLAGVLAEHCLASMRARGVETGAKDWAIMLAAHGTVVNPPAGVDNGLNHAGRVLIRLKAMLRPHAGAVRVGWLNHTRGGKWTTPPVAEALAKLRERGFGKLVYYPWGFTTDNAETALEGRVALAAMPEPFGRVEYLECLNSGEGFVKLLADRVCEHLGVTAERASEPRRAGILKVVA